MEKSRTLSEYSSRKRLAGILAVAGLVAGGVLANKITQEPENTPRVAPESIPGPVEVVGQIEVDPASQRSKATVSFKGKIATKSTVQANEANEQVTADETQYGHVIIADDPENYGYSNNLDTQNHPNQNLPQQPDTPRSPRQP